MVTGFRELHEAFNFTVEIEGSDGPGAGFQSAGPIEYEITTTEYQQGGSIIPIKDPDSVKFAPFKLERGASSDLFFYQWVVDVVQACGVGYFDTLTPDSRYKRTVIVKQFDRRKRTVKLFRLINAFPVNFKAGDWDATRDAVVIEGLTLQYDYPTTTIR